MIWLGLIACILYSPVLFTRRFPFVHAYIHTYNQERAHVIDIETLSMVDLVELRKIKIVRNPLFSAVSYDYVLLYLLYQTHTMTRYFI